MVEVVQKRVCIYLCHIDAHHLHASFTSKLLANDQQIFLAECSPEVHSISSAFFSSKSHLDTSANPTPQLSHTKESSFKLGQHPSKRSFEL